MTGPSGRTPTSRTASPRLPRSARERLARSEHATARPSFLSVPAAYGVRTAGFEAIGDVMGCIAFQTTVEYVGSCGMTRSSMARPPVVVTASAGSTFTSYLRQLAGAYRTALDRLRREATALGADGVVGISLQLAREEHQQDVVAVGTAVRSTGRTRPGRVFTTDLAGQDVAKLVQSGWVPVDLHAAVRVAVRHDRGIYPTRSTSRPQDFNFEVVGYTQLRQRASQAVRDALRAQVTRVGADGALLSGLTVDMHERRCLNFEGEDLVALATATGTSVARFARASTPMPSPLVVLPLGKGRS